MICIPVLYLIVGITIGAMVGGAVGWLGGVDWERKTGRWSKK